MSNPWTKNTGVKPALKPGTMIDTKTSDGNLAKNIPYDDWQMFNFKTNMFDFITEWRLSEGSVSTDNVRNPKHYQMCGIETITIIASCMTESEWLGYCRGNIIKYRLRAGKKGDAAECLAKADFYEELYEQHKHLCRQTTR